MFRKASKGLLKLSDGTCIEGLLLNEKLSNTHFFSVSYATNQLGYQEAITDPSYKGQLLVLTSPHIGSTGINKKLNESDEIHIRGLVLSSLEPGYGHHSSESDTLKWLENKVPVLHSVDTRSLALYLRKNRNTLQGSITEEGNNNQLVLIEDAENWDGKIETSEYSCNKDYVLLIDFGCKKSIESEIANSGLAFVKSSIQEAFSLSISRNISAVIFSNGPGNPTDVYARFVPQINKLLSLDIPILGICMGFQLIALAYGAKIKRMDFSHNSTNHPIIDYNDNKVLVTTHNHMYCIDESISQSQEVEITHRSLVDGVIEGIKIKNRKIAGYQFHPEAGPGPSDSLNLLQNFLNGVKLDAETKKHKKYSHNRFRSYCHRSGL